MPEHYEPTGIRFYDQASRRSMILVTEGPWYGWLCYRHVEGQWVTLRKATDDDRRRIVTAAANVAMPTTCLDANWRPTN